MPGEGLRLVLAGTAYASHIVGFGEHLMADEVDRELARGADSPVGVVALAHADQNPVVADNPYMCHDEPVDAAVDLGPDDRQRHGVECQGVSYEFLFHGGCI